jgi:hypothetical protein
LWLGERDFYEQNAEAVEFWTPGSPVFSHPLNFALIGTFGGI